MQGVIQMLKLNSLPIRQHPTQTETMHKAYVLSNIHYFLCHFIMIEVFCLIFARYYISSMVKYPYSSLILFINYLPTEKISILLLRYFNRINRRIDDIGASELIINIHYIVYVFYGVFIPAGAVLFYTTYIDTDLS